ncbi:MAG: hypothetical protein ACODAJ_09130 [Planctomycetota bacterium]
MTIRRSVLVVVVLALGGRASAAERETVVDLTLVGGLCYRDRGPQPGDPSMLLELRRADGRWGRVWGYAGDYNIGHHVGHVTDGQIGDERLSLSLSMEIQDDPWVKGGLAAYELALEKTGERKYAGTFQGTVHGYRLEGEARAEVRPPQPNRKPGYEPAAMGERPRLLLREQDLPRLRQRMATPLGKAALARMTTAAGLALRYQLRDEGRFAAKAREQAEQIMADRGNGSKMVRSRVWAWRAEQLALAYDLCYDAWPAAFRQQVEGYLVFTAERVFFRKATLHSEMSWHFASRYPGTISSAGAFAGLALWGEKGPEPQKPPEPAYVRRIAPDADYEPPEGVPVVGFQSDAMPDDWIFVGGFRPEAMPDPLEALGGPAKARPKPGDTVRHGGRTETFRHIPRGEKKGYWRNARFTGNRLQIDITNAIGRVYHSTSYFYTVVRNDRPRWVRLRTGHGLAEAWLAGAHLRDKQFARIEAGLYPMLVGVPIGETNPWGVIAMEPRLIEMPKDEVDAGVAALKAGYGQRVGDWRVDLQQWKATDGANVEFLKLFEVGRRIMFLTCRQGIGTGGFQGSNQFPMGLEGAQKYAAAYRNAFCRDVSSYGDLTRYLPYKMFRCFYTAEGERAQQLNGNPHLRIDNVYHETRDLTLDFFAPLFPLIPDQLQPAALWHWNHHAGILNAADQPERLLASQQRPYDYTLFESLPVWTFVNYPLGMKPTSPTEGMPAVWPAPQFGYVGFRKWIDGRNDILVEAYGRCYPCGGGSQPNAGTVRLVGFGEPWSHSFEPIGEYRFAENVVQFPDDTINAKGCGRLVTSKLDDESGVVTFDLGDVYAGPVEGQKALYERYGGVRRDVAFGDSGMRGLRSVAVDLSGASGAPCLVAIADQIHGGARKVWTWQLESSLSTAAKAAWADERKGGKKQILWKGKRHPYRPNTVIDRESRRIDDDPAVRIEGRTFTIRRGGATLRGLFVAPADLALEFGERAAYTIQYKGGISRSYSRAVFAESRTGRFLVLLTLSRGEHPKPNTEGHGLDAVVTLGQRTVRFDGGKLLLGTAKRAE